MRIEPILLGLASRRTEKYRLRRGIDVLSLDWDAFTGDCSVNSKCCGFCKTMRKVPGRVVRGSPHRVNEDSKEILENPNAFVGEFIGRPLAVVVTECHADLSFLIAAPDQVICVDAHEDSDYWHGEEGDAILCCSTWGSMIFNLLTLFSVYDLKKTITSSRGNGLYPCGGYTGRGKIRNFSADLVHICLSSPWTPASEDAKFYGLVKHVASLCEIREPVFFGHRARNLSSNFRKWED